MPKGQERKDRNQNNGSGKKGKPEEALLEIETPMINLGSVNSSHRKTGPKQYKYCEEQDRHERPLLDDNPSATIRRHVHPYFPGRTIEIDRGEIAHSCDR
jgi:hypothetical protein